MGREFEIKYAATATSQAAIRQEFADFQTITMETTYFDTADGALATRMITLRLRKENCVCICTLKTPLPDGNRGEWECHATEIEAGLTQLIREGAPAEIALLTKTGLLPVCGAKFTRLATQVDTADGTAELALDKGVLLGGSKEMPLCEIEVELKTGSETAALAFAHRLAEKHGLIPEKRSKFRRAMLLAKGD